MITRHGFFEKSRALPTIIIPLSVVLEHLTNPSIATDFFEIIVAILKTSPLSPVLIAPIAKWVYAWLVSNFALKA